MKLSSLKLKQQQLGRVMTSQVLTRGAGNLTRGQLFELGKSAAGVFEA